jgi:hypothetical protein
LHLKLVLADMNGRNGNFCQLIKVHGVNDLRQTEMYTAEPLLPAPSCFMVEIANEELVGFKSPGIDQIPAEMIKTKGNILSSEIHILTNSIWNKEEEQQHWKKRIIVPVYKKGDKTGCTSYRRISVLPTTYKILSN